MSLIETVTWGFVIVILINAYMIDRLKSVDTRGKLSDLNLTESLRSLQTIAQDNSERLDKLIDLLDSIKDKLDDHDSLADQLTTIEEAVESVRTQFTKERLERDIRRAYPASQG